MKKRLNFGVNVFQSIPNFAVLCEGCIRTYVYMLRFIRIHRYIHTTLLNLSLISMMRRSSLKRLIGKGGFLTNINFITGTSKISTITHGSYAFPRIQFFHLFSGNWSNLISSSSYIYVMNFLLYELCGLGFKGEVMTYLLLFVNRQAYMFIN